MASLVIRTSNGDFDLYGTEKVVQSFSIFDFSDLTLRSGEFTNTFKIPLTSNNIRLINYSNNINVNNSFGYQKINCEILIDGLTIRSGFLVINSIDENINCNFYSGNTVFYEALKNKTLQDLDWSIYNHNWTYASVLNKSSDTTGYVYPIIDYGGANLASDIVDVRKLLPATYVKTIVDRIIQNSGYTQVYDFDAADFQIALLPFSKKNPEVSSAVLLLNKVDLDRTSNYNSIVPDSVITYDNTTPYIIPPDFKFMNFSFNSIGTVGSSTLYNLLTNEFSPQYTGTYDFNVLVDLNLNLGTTLNFSPAIKDPQMLCQTDLHIVKVSGVVETTVYTRNIGRNAFSAFGATTYTTITPPSSATDYTANTGSVYLNVGEKLKFFLVHSVTNLQFTPTALVTDITIQRNLQILSNNTLNVDLKPALVFGGLITYDSMVPPIRCSDFIRDICIRFGLVLSVNENSKVVTFKKLDSVIWNINNSIDWSDKIDLSNEPQLAFRYDNYAQVNNFKHKEDKTIAETPIGSDYQLLINNGTLIKEKDLYTSQFGVSEQTIWTANSVRTIEINLYDTAKSTFSKDVAYRIAFSEGVTGEFKITDGTTTSGYINNRVCWFVDLNKPTQSMGFGFNLIEKNSSTIINVLDDLKLIRLKCKLSVLDILNYDFFRPVYIEHYNAYFILSLISQFDYTEENLTTVELIKLN